jgi:hypothetical protein
MVLLRVQPSLTSAHQQQAACSCRSADRLLGFDGGAPHHLTREAQPSSRP